MWQGSLTLKNDQAHVQMHFIGGSQELASSALPAPETTSIPGMVNMASLKIMQRMRLEQQQLEGVTKRMMVCLHILALKTSL